MRYIFREEDWYSIQFLFYFMTKLWESETKKWWKIHKQFKSSFQIQQAKNHRLTSHQVLALHYMKKKDLKDSGGLAWTNEVITRK